MNIPNNFIVQCPDRHQKLSHATKVCIQCEHFGGLVKISELEDEPFNKKYRIICKFPRVMKGWMLDD